jgi:serine/threonine protein phosphatase PrpC
LSPDIDYIVIGCDGLYDEMSDDDIVTFINDGLAQEKELDEIAKELVEEAIELGSTDNVSVIIVKLDKKFQKLITKSAQLEVDLDLLFTYL